MKVPLTYRPPSIRSSLNTYVDDDEISGNKISCGVPDTLSFDRILDGGTCPPMTTRQFMDYLQYVEHSAENLQFLLWFRDYQKRFNALPEAERNLSPEWVEAPGKPSTPGGSSNVNRPKQMKGENIEYAYRVLSEAALHNGPQTPSYITTFAGPNGSSISPSFTRTTTGSTDPFNTPPASSGKDTTTTLSAPSPAYIAPWSTSEPISTTNSNIAPFLGPPSPSSSGPQTPKQDFRTAAAEAFTSIEQKWQPFTIQPFRLETAKIVALYLNPSSPRELNISSTDRLTVLKALTHTTHPSSFEPIARHIEWLLRRQAHPNFVRWSIYNANPPRVWLARILGIGTMLIGFVLSSTMFIDVSRFSRWARGFAGFPFWMVGMATVIAGLQGMCLVVHGLHKRQLKPWELWPEDEEGNFDIHMGNVELKTALEVQVKELPSPSHESTWKDKYQTRYLLRRVFDKEERVEEPVLRSIQDVIVIQSFTIGLLFAAIVTAIYVSVA